MITAAVARSIRIVGLDVDGVLTDGGFYLGDVGGAPFRAMRYDIQDGLGMRFLREAGIRVAIVTGRSTESVRMRAEELGVDDLVQDPTASKLPAFRDILARNGISAEHAAFVGDDVPDLDVLRLVGLPVAVGNAVADVRAVAKVQLTREGGHGAVREFVEMLLRARGEWDAVIARYLAARATSAPAVR